MEKAAVDEQGLMIPVRECWWAGCVAQDAERLIS